MNSCLLALALALALFVGPTAAQAEGGKALLVGIDSYSSRDIPQLKGSKEDVDAMRDFIGREWHLSGEQVRTLKDAQATKAAILDALDNWLIAETRPGDLAIIYVSSHGEEVFDQDGDEVGDNPTDPRKRFDEALVPYDAVRDRPETFLIDDELHQRLLRLRDRQVLLITDACHSGTMTRGAAAAATKNIQIRLREGGGDLADNLDHVIAWSAVTQSENARFDRIGERYGGIFTDAFIRGGDGAADADGDGRVSNAELLAFVRKASREYYDSRNMNEPMTPTFEPVGPALSWDVRSFRPPPGAGAAMLAGLPPGEGTVSIRQVPAGTVRAGESRTFKVDSSVAGKLLLLDIDISGKITQLFPNRISARGATTTSIRPGEDVYVPDWNGGFSIKATPTPGMVIAIVVADDVPLAAAEAALVRLAPGDVLPVPDNPEAYANAIVATLSKAWTGGAFNRPIRMARGYLKYEVQP